MTSPSVLLGDRRWIERSAGLLVALGTLFAPALAIAQAPLELRWDAPRECPSERQVRDRVLKLAGSVRSADSPLGAEATVTRKEEGGLRLELVVRAGSRVGTRSIDGRSCDDLAGATAVALALLLRSSEPLTEGDLVGGEPAEKPLPAAPKTPPSPLPASDEPARARRWHVLLQAPLGVFGLGPLPEPTSGVALAAGASFDRWRFLLEGSAWLEQRLEASDEPGTRADLTLVSAGVRACRTALQGGFELAPCLTLTVEHLRARGSGDHITPRTAEETWLAAGAGLEARWRVAPWFALVGGVSGQIEASRPRIAIDGVGTLGQTLPAALRSLAGAEWIF